MKRLVSVFVLLCCGISVSWADSLNEQLKLASVSALAMDAESGELLFEKHANLRMPIASITKVMTAMVVLDGGQSLREKIRFTEKDRDAITHYFSRILNHHSENSYCKSINFPAKTALDYLVFDFFSIMICSPVF